MEDSIVQDAVVVQLEEWIDTMTEDLPELTSFLVLPTRGRSPPRTCMSLPPSVAEPNGSVRPIRT